MAQQDPYGIPTMDPVVADAYGQSQWEPPPEFWEPWNPNSPSLNVPEYGTPSMPVSLPPLPEHHRPAAQISKGTANVIEQAAAPALGIDPDLIEMEEPGVKIGQPRPPGVANLLPAPTVDRELAVPELDAVSGADGGIVPFGAGTALPEPVYDNVSTPGTPQYSPAGTPGPSMDIGSRELTDEQLAEIIKDPAKLAFFEMKNERDRANWKAEQEGIARRRDEFNRERAHKQLLEIHEKTRKDMDDLGASIKALASTKIVRDRRSNTSRILDGLLAGFGGLVSARTGGPNVGLQMVTKAIDDDVEIQKAELSNKMQVLGMQKGLIEGSHNREMEIFKATEAYRIASYDRAMADIATQATQFDPKGTTYIAFGKMMHGLAQQKQAAEAAAIDRFYKINKADADLQEQLLKNEAAKRKLGMGAGGGVGGVAPAGKDSYTADELKAIVGPGAWVPPPAKGTDGKPKKYTIAEYEKLAKAVKSGHEVTEAGKKDIHEQQGGRIGKKGEFMMADGKTEFTLPPGPEAKDLREQKAAVDSLVYIMDGVRRLRTGWSNSVVNKKEFQRINAMWSAGRVKYKDLAKLGALSESDYALLDGALGSSDPTKFFDQSAGIESARSTTLRLFSDMLRSKGWDSPIDYNPPDTSKPGAPPPKSEIDKMVEGAQAKVGTEAHEGIMRMSPLGNVAADTSKNAGGTVRSQQVESLGRLARSDDPKTRDAALAGLHEVRTNAPDEDVRVLASTLLSEALMANAAKHNEKKDDK